MISLPFFFAGFTSAPEDSAEGSRSGPRASARTADEVRAGRGDSPAGVLSAGHLGSPLNGDGAEGHDATGTNRGGAVNTSPGLESPEGPARTFYDILFDSIKATVEAFDGH